MGRLGIDYFVDATKGLVKEQAFISVRERHDGQGRIVEQPMW